MKEVSYWLVSENKNTGEKTFGVGRYGPKFLIQGKEVDVENLVACLNGDTNRCKI